MRNWFASSKPAGSTFISRGQAGSAWLLFKEGKAAEADREFQAALPVLRSTASSSLRQARPLVRHGAVLSNLGRYQAAQDQIASALEIYRQEPASSQADSAEALFQLAELGAKQGHTGEAGKNYTLALAPDRSAGRAARFQLPLIFGATLSSWLQRARCRESSNSRARR